MTVSSRLSPESTTQLIMDGWAMVRQPGTDPVGVLGCMDELKGGWMGVGGWVWVAGLGRVGSAWVHAGVTRVHRWRDGRRATRQITEMGRPYRHPRHISPPSASETIRRPHTCSD